MNSEAPPAAAPTASPSFRSFTSEARSMAAHANGWSRHSSAAAMQKNRTPPRTSSSLSPPKYAASAGRSTSENRKQMGGGAADDDAPGASPASSQFRLIGTTSTRAARAVATRITILGEEQRLRADAKAEEAGEWVQLVSQLHAAVVMRHKAMAATPSLVPLTNAIDGIPLLASVFVPPASGAASNQAPGAGRVAEYSARGSNKTSRASPRGNVVLDGNVLVKAAAYDAVKSSTGRQEHGEGGPALHERRPMRYGQPAASAVTASRDLTSPPGPDSPSSRSGHPSRKSPASPSATADDRAPVLRKDADNARKMSQTLDAIRQFDTAVQKQKEQVAAQFSECNNAWMPHKDIAFLYGQWRTFLLKWCRRAGATPSALLASFLCTLLIDANTDAETAANINRVVMEEALEVVCDATPSSTCSNTADDDVLTLHYGGAGGGEPHQAASCITTDSASSWVEDCLNYTGFCYVLRNVGMGIFPARDPVAAIHLLVVVLTDHYHRAHY